MESKVNPEKVEEAAVEDNGGDFFSAFKKKKFVDPPMPNIGKFVGVTLTAIMRSSKYFLIALLFVRSV